MILLITVGIWYTLGIMGCWAATSADVSKGLDFTIRDLLLCFVLALGGPVIFVIGIAEFVKQKEFFDRVLVKGKE